MYLCLCTCIWYMLAYVVGFSLDMPLRVLWLIKLFILYQKLMCLLLLAKGTLPSVHRMCVTSDSACASKLFRIKFPNIRPVDDKYAVVNKDEQ